MRCRDYTPRNRRPSGKVVQISVAEVADVLSADFTGEESVGVRSRDICASDLHRHGAKVSAPLLDGGGEFTKKNMGLSPVDAGVGDALSIDKRLAVYESLRSSDKIAFDHDTDDATLPARDLP